MISVYNSKETDFQHNGMTVLGECITAEITEELNGLYELELTYPLDNRGKWQHLIEDNIIKADGQLFRIYRKKKDMSSIRVNARHIFYDLLDNFIENTTATNINGILNNTLYPHAFTGSGISGTGVEVIRKNPVEAIFTILGQWKGEIIRDNFNIQLLSARGTDKGYLISYRKNLVGLDEELNLDNVITRLCPIGKDGLTLPEKYIDSPLINAYSKPKVRTVEFQDAETVEQLRQQATIYINSGLDIPLVNYKVNFVELSKTEQYKNYLMLATVDMGDIVTVRHSKLGIDIKNRVIKTKKNVLNNRFEVIELGNFKENAYTSINKISNAVSNAVTTTYVDTSIGQLKNEFISKDKLINIVQTVNIPTGAAGTIITIAVDAQSYNLTAVTGLYCSIRDSGLYICPKNTIFENGKLKTIELNIRYLDSKATAGSQQIYIGIASY